VTEASIAEWKHENPTEQERLMERICERENLMQALGRVRRNKGSAGVDGMKVEQLRSYLKVHWPSIKEQLLSGGYKPSPVLRVEIPKPNGGRRKLGVPTVTDRFIQQAILQVLQPQWEPLFSESSYGFRPGRSAHQAIRQAKQYVSDGCRWVVDIDIAEFFDRVNHDRLMSRLAKRIGDKRLLKLIRGYLNAGVLEGGLVQATKEGTPQGGPLSPLLSNVVLDELDKELEQRGHKFVRYADDCNIYVKSKRAGERTMQSASRFIARKLKLQINEQKSAVERPWKGKFLGISFTPWKPTKIRLSKQALERLKGRIRQETLLTKARSIEATIKALSEYLRGWKTYYQIVEASSGFCNLDSWIRRRLRCVQWRRWGTNRNRYKSLRKMGVWADLAKGTAGTNKGAWHTSDSKALHMALTTGYYRKLGLYSLSS